MTRIQPECFVEVWGDGIKTNQESFKRNGNPYAVPVCNIKALSFELNKTAKYKFSTIALFLIKPTTTPLSQRLEARGLNNVKH